MAIETGTPILPLVLDGTHPALQKGDWRFGVADAEVRVLEPVETAGMTIDDVSVLRDRVHDDDRRRTGVDEGGLMPLLFASDDDRDLVRAERDVGCGVQGSRSRPAVAWPRCPTSSVRATAVRNHMENGVLAQHELSWSAFTTLFVLRVWGDMDARSLAAEAGVTAATLTGVMKTLEGRGLLRRKGDRADGRRILVSLTPRGRNVVGDVMPAFNRHESLVTQALTEAGARRPRPIAAHHPANDRSHRPLDRVRVQEVGGEAAGLVDEPGEGRVGLLGEHLRVPLHGEHLRPTVELEAFDRRRPRRCR